MTQEAKNIASEYRGVVAEIGWNVPEMRKISYLHTNCLARGSKATCSL